LGGKVPAKGLAVFIVKAIGNDVEQPIEAWFAVKLFLGLHSRFLSLPLGKAASPVNSADGQNRTDDGAAGIPVKSDAAAEACGHFFHLRRQARVHQG